MEAIVERCCGIDVHQAQVTVCVLLGRADEKPRKMVRTFGTMTRHLVELREWLTSLEVTTVAMEATGVYWKPVYAILEGYFDLIVGNAHHIKNVPGRKTDVKDSEWIADLARHGLIRKSFVPPKPIRELRDLVRYRIKLVAARASECNRLLKMLEQANIKLSSVASDVFGLSGRRMLRALLSGTATPEEMAQLAKGKLRQKLPELALALDGHLEEHHRFILAMQFERINQLDRDVDTLDTRIATCCAPYQAQLSALDEIPGIDRALAAAILAELGTDMSVFASPAHAAAWAGVAPGNHESAGRSKKVHARRGNHFLKLALVQAAKAAARTKRSYFRAKYHRLAQRRGPMRAQVAVARKILIAVFHVLSGATYKDLGIDYLDNLNKARTITSLLRRLKSLGVDIAPTQQSRVVNV